MLFLQFHTIVLKEMDFAHLLTDYYALAVLIVAALAFLYLMLSYGLTFMKMGVMRTGKKSKKGEDNAAAPYADNPNLPVTVVIVAHNGAEKLRQHLACIMSQNYPNYEIVVVDYKSQDDTGFVLQLCEPAFPGLRRVPIKNDVNFFQGKKFPLAIGIQSAKNDVLVLTDVDCEPLGFQWLNAIVSAYKNDSTKMVIAPTVLDTKPGLLGALQQYENLVRNAQMLAVAASGKAYTGMGSNLSYRRSFFFENDGFSRHYTEPEGSDDIFVNRNSHKGNTAVVLNDDALVKKEAATTFGSWHYHRRQRISTRCYYSFFQRLRIAMRPLMLVLFYAACIYMFFLPSVPWLIPSLLLLVKLVWQIVCVMLAQKRFSLRNYHWFSPLLELYFLVADTILAIITLHPKRCNP